MVIFRDDIDTFCKYLAHRPPNVDHTVHQHIEDRHLEEGIRGLHYIARYEHRSDNGQAITVGLDQFCGRIELDEDIGTDTIAARRLEAVERQVREVAARVGGTIHKAPIRYSGEAVFLPR